MEVVDLKEQIKQVEKVISFREMNLVAARSSFERVSQDLLAARRLVESAYKFRNDLRAETTKTKKKKSK